MRSTTLLLVAVLLLCGLAHAKPLADLQALIQVADGTAAGGGSEDAPVSTSQNRVVDEAEIDQEADSGASSGDSYEEEGMGGGETVTLEDRREAKIMRKQQAIALNVIRRIRDEARLAMRKIRTTRVDEIRRYLEDKAKKDE